MDAFRRSTLYLSTPEKIEHYLSQDAEERTPEQILEISMWLRSCSSLFKELDPDRMGKVINSLVLVLMKPDHVIVHQGEEGQCFYVIIRGSATVYAKKVQKNDKGHAEPVLMDVNVVRGVKDRARFGSDLCVLYTGRCIGELSVIKHQERAASVISDDNISLIKIQREIYEKYIEEKHVEEILLRSYYMGNHPTFRHWLSSYRDLIAENLRLRHFKFGEEIFREGSPVKSVYFVVEGLVKLTINPSAELGDLSKLLAKQGQGTDEEKWWLNDGHLDQFKKLSVIERRKLRREEGYHAAEKRYRDLSICVIGKQGLLGDVEATLQLKNYTSTAVCIQQLQLYEMEKSDFIQLILNKNPDTYDRIRDSIHEKLAFRNNSQDGGIPVFNALLTYFQKAPVKDTRKQIIKAYEAKRKAPVNMSFFDEMSKGRTSNRPEVKGIETKRGNVSTRYNEDSKKEQTEVGGSFDFKASGRKSSKKQLLSLWRNTARNVVIRKKNHNETHAPKQFSADEYKVLKKKMQALGKSTQVGAR